MRMFIFSSDRSKGHAHPLAKMAMGRTHRTRNHYGRRNLIEVYGVRGLNYSTDGIEVSPTISFNRTMLVVNYLATVSSSTASSWDKEVSQRSATLLRALSTRTWKMPYWLGIRQLTVGRWTSLRSCPMQKLLKGLSEKLQKDLQIWKRESIKRNGGIVFFTPLGCQILEFSLLTKDEDNVR